MKTFDPITKPENLIYYLCESMNVIELFIFDASIAFKSFMKIVSTFSFVISENMKRHPFEQNKIIILVITESSQWHDYHYKFCV